MYSVYVYVNTHVQALGRLSKFVWMALAVHLGSQKLRVKLPRVALPRCRMCVGVRSPPGETDPGTSA